MKKRYAEVASVFSGTKYPAVIAHVTDKVQGCWITKFTCDDTGQDIILASVAEPISPITGGSVSVADSAEDSRFSKNSILDLQLIANLDDGTSLRAPKESVSYTHLTLPTKA